MDAGVGVARDDVPQDQIARGRDPAAHRDPGPRIVDEYADLVSQSPPTGHVGAEEVASDHVPAADGAGDLDPDDIARDQVPRIGRAADHAAGQVADLIGGCVVEKHAQILAGWEKRIQGLWDIDRPSPVEIRADEVAQDLIASCAPIEEVDAGRRVSRDDVPQHGQRAADRVAGHVDQDDPYGVAQGGGAREIGADEVALHQVLLRVLTEDHDPRVGIARDEVARTLARSERRPTDHIGNTRVDDDPDRVRQRDVAGCVGADEIAHHGHVRCVQELHPRAVVARDNIAHRINWPTDQDARGVGDEDTVLGVAEGETSGRIGPDQVADDDRGELSWHPRVHGRDGDPVGIVARDDVALSGRRAADGIAR